MHSKYQLFNINASTPNYNGIDLLATASTFGLIIAGKPSSNEFQGLLSFLFLFLRNNEHLCLKRIDYVFFM